MDSSSQPLGSSPQPAASRERRFWLLLLVLVSAALGIGASLVLPHYVRDAGAGKLSGCSSNLKNIGTALEMYRKDHGGRFPETLGLLAPHYLREIPACPGAGRDTYSESYRAGLTDFTLLCQGHDNPSDFPRYSSTRGLELR